MSDENQDTAKPRFTRDDWTLAALFALVLILILINQTIGLDNVLAKLKDLSGNAMAWAITGVWIALAVKLFWP